MNHIKTYEQMNEEFSFGSPDNKFNKWRENNRKRSQKEYENNPMLQDVRKQIEDMPEDKKIEFVEKLISSRKKGKNRFWFFYALPLIFTFFYFPEIMTQPLTAVLTILYAIITVLIESPIDELKHLKKDLISLQDDVEDEIE